MMQEAKIIYYAAVIETIWLIPFTILFLNLRKLDRLTIWEEMYIKHDSILFSKVIPIYKAISYAILSLIYIFGENNIVFLILYAASLIFTIMVTCAYVVEFKKTSTKWKNLSKREQFRLRRQKPNKAQYGSNTQRTLPPS